MFSKKIEPMCIICERGVVMHNQKYIICKKRGVVTATYACGRFVYDPLKRIPPKKHLLKQRFTQSDFSIE
jgi:hypothetical protein